MPRLCVTSRPGLRILSQAMQIETELMELAAVCESRNEVSRNWLSKLNPTGPVAEEQFNGD
ncbi:hypothetical protein K2D_34780 [Planctomycetes bacterium K2D]|nr:hypothetical protein K2D_34780 [Planctomycetes bacterium K2D]